MRSHRGIWNFVCDAQNQCGTERRGEMLQFLRVGIIAASLQLIIVTLVSCPLSVTPHQTLVVPAINETTPTADFLYIYWLLKLLFLLVAVGIVLTDTKCVASTAARIRHASRLMRPRVPDHAANTLLVLLALPTAGFAILTLQEPSDVVIALTGYSGRPTWFWITWSALMSVGAAFFVHSHMQLGDRAKRPASQKWSLRELIPPAKAPLKTPFRF